jgi:phospholipid/cholesterol/gamma-HCH transport system substrate-binding protein
VGTIKAIKFTGPSKVDVYMSIDEATQQYIHRNAMAQIRSDGLIGNKLIVIDGGSPQAPIVEDGDVLQAEKLLSTDDMLATLQDNNQNLLAITTDFKTLGHQHTGRVKAPLAHYWPIAPWLYNYAPLCVTCKLLLKAHQKWQFSLITFGLK